MFRFIDEFRPALGSSVSTMWARRWVEGVYGVYGRVHWTEPGRTSTRWGEEFQGPPIHRNRVMFLAMVDLNSGTAISAADYWRANVVTSEGLGPLDYLLGAIGGLAVLRAITSRAIRAIAVRRGAAAMPATGSEGRAAAEAVAAARSMRGLRSSAAGSRMRGAARDAPADPRTITLFHGTGGAGLRGIGGLGRGRIDVTRTGGAHQDLGRGFYLTTEREVAVEYAQRSAKKAAEMAQTVQARHVAAWEVPLDKLGVVVDIRPGGNFAAQWRAFLRRPFEPFPGGRLPGVPTYREAIARFADKRGSYFDEFLASVNRSGADTIIAPVGTAPFSGTGLGTQVCLRTQRVADVLNGIMDAAARAR